jgi:hypothetical protein
MLSLQVPAGFYSGTITPRDILFLVYTPLVTTTANLETLPGTLRFGGIFFSLQAHLSNTVLNDYNFDAPLLLEIEYPASAVEGLDAEAFTLRYWDHQRGVWAKDGVKVLSHDPIGHKITFALSHLTDFALFSDLAKMLFIPALYD